MKRDTRKLILAILLNIFLVGMLFFMLDFLNIFTFGQFSSFLGLGKSEIPKIEDPFLLEREEHRKQWQVLELKEKELAAERLKFNEEVALLKDHEEKLRSLEAQIKEREKRIIAEAEERGRRALQIRRIADQLVNMEPEKAVARLEEQTDDLLVIDLLKGMDAIYEEQGRKSVVPYLLSLMKAERAATLQRKMANQPSIKESEF